MKDGNEMEGNFEPEEQPLLVEWRGTSEWGHLLLKEGMNRFDVQTQMGILLTMAGFGIGMVLAAVPQSDRQVMAQRLVRDALSLADKVVGTDPDEAGVDA